MLLNILIDLFEISTFNDMLYIEPDVPRIQNDKRKSVTCLANMFQLLF